MASPRTAAVPNGSNERIISTSEANNLDGWIDPKEPLAPASGLVACVDYSVARGSPLIAYRYDGEPELSAEKFVTVSGLRPQKTESFLRDSLFVPIL